jgi:hypothetical protein
MSPLGKSWATWGGGLVCARQVDQVLGGRDDCRADRIEALFRRKVDFLGVSDKQTLVASLSLVPPPKRRAAAHRRALHNDEAGSFEVLHKSLRDDLGHDLVRVVDALAALISQCEGEGGGKVGRVGRREGFGRVEHATG